MNTKKESTATKAYITLKDGSKIEFTPLKASDANIKVNLNDSGSANGEGIWATVSAEDKKRHDNNTSSGRFVCMLVNHAIAFYPAPSWGLHIVAEFRGSNRPVANIELVDYNQKENRIWSEDVPEEMRK